MTTTNDQIFALAAKYGISDADLAKRLHVSIHAIAAWRRPPTSRAHRKAKPGSLALLQQLTREN